VTIFTLIVSDLQTGRVRRFSGLDQDAARRKGERYRACGRTEKGHRVELVWRDVTELPEGELRALLGGMGEGDLAAIMGGE
jgi:hypothetical protein